MQTLKRLQSIMNIAMAIVVTYAITTALDNYHSNAVMSPQQSKQMVYLAPKPDIRLQQLAAAISATPAFRHAH